MSLRIWLPLTKDLRQQGLDNVTVTNNGATFDSAGKLGGCYNFNGSSKYISITNPLKSTSEVSCAVWVKPSTNTSTNEQIMNIGTSSGWNNIRFGILQRSINQFIFHISNGTNNITYSCASGTIPVDQWIHISCVYKNRELKMYLNGELVKTYSISFDPSFTGITNIGIGAAPNGSEKFTGYISDVRIYDHALSQMEVKELAKGLVLHYPLNRGGLGQENLASQYIMPGGNSPGTTSTAGRTNYYGDYGIIIPATENADTYFSIWYPEPLESGVVYTLSAEVSGLLEGSYYNFPLFAQNNTSMGIIQFNHNGLNKLTFTMNYTGTITTATVGGKTYYRMFMDDNGRAIVSGQGAITIKNIKLEKGSIATPWCPNSSDELATTMGFNSTTEYDCSGFCNNGTRMGTFSWTSDTPKYAVSQVFNGTDNAIQTPNLLTMITDKNYTIACWTYKTVIGTKGYQTIYGGPSGFELEARSGSSTSPLYRIHNWGGGTTAYNFGEWTHFCFVHTDSDSKLYVNGEVKITGTSVNIPNGNYFIGAWNTATQQNFDGLMSDFRIYATALSADDVKSLYQNSAYIDSSGNIYGAVHEEV